ncbi:MAG: D-2-hydroxyacid dehydrogenase [Armatimonadetes bacterium]|nr:D-2-hydroxyacid dehydrogenase [Armatimonadota bacterium]
MTAEGSRAAPIVVVASGGSAAGDDRVRAVDARIRLVRVDDETISSALADADVFWGSDLTAAQVDAAARLRWIHNPGVGVDGLPWDALRPRDVIVTHGRGGHEVLMAEYVVGGFLMFARRLHVALRNQVARGDWDRPPAIGATLAGSTVALLGVGGIGQAIAHRLRPFDVRILGVCRTPRPIVGVDENHGPEGLAGVLRTADYVAVTLPLTPQTRGLIGERALAWMRPHAVIVNVGRGEVIDESALVLAMRSGRLGGAMLDVFEEEPLPASSPLWRLENVVITPHASGAGPARARHNLDVFCDNLRRFAGGEALRYVVDAARGY